MQAKLWTINGLATELRIDRRALARKLEGLKPAKATQRTDGSTIRYWFLADVAEHLQRPSHGGTEELDPARERALLDRARREAQELQNSEARGKLIPSEVVVLLGIGLVKAARAKFLALHSKVKSKFPSIGHDVIDEISRLVREALSELGEDGLHPELRERIHETARRLDTASEPDDQ